MLIIPAIIPQSLDDLESKLSLVRGKALRVQVDVTDGVYVPSKSWPYNNNFIDFVDIENQSKGFPYWEEIDFEFDLMIRFPETESERYLKAGASTVIFHLESTDYIEECISLARNYNAEIGLAIKPSTPLEKIYPHVERADFIQFMGNDKVGSQGVTLDERVYEKISTLHNLFPNAVLGVDIGVNFETAPKLRDAGTTRLVSGSAIFQSGDIEGAIKRLQTF